MTNQPINAKSLDELASRRIGRFVVSKQLLDHDSIWKVFAMLKFVPLIVQHDKHNALFAGLSHRFEPIPAAKTFPLQNWPMYLIHMNFEECPISGKPVVASLKVEKQSASGLIQVARG